MYLQHSQSEPKTHNMHGLTKRHDTPLMKMIRDKIVHFVRHSPSAFYLTSVCVVMSQPTFAYVPACVFDGGVAVDVGQQAEAETVFVVGRVREAVHQHTAGRRVKRLTHPVVELVVGDGTPVLWLLVTHGSQI